MTLPETWKQVSNPYRHEAERIEQLDREIDRLKELVRILAKERYLLMNRVACRGRAQIKARERALSGQ